MWKKKGLIYNVAGEHDWNKSHAQVPVADILDDRIRIFFATRNGAGKSNISFVDVDQDNPSKVINVATRTMLPFGQPGTFDDSGIMPSSIVRVGSRKYLYYVGWTTRQTVPYHNSVGLAISDDGGETFRKHSEGPVITVNHREPYFSGTALVKLEGSLFRMWYLSCIGWELHDGKQEPLYNIKYSESKDGINWDQTGKVAIDLQGDEGGIVSAAVIREENVYKMWYGKRKRSGYRDNKQNSYRIGYAESPNGIDWTRMDEKSGIDVSESGWDSEMVSYPYVFEHNNQLTMLYNGNGFGRSGFGYAIWNK